jgi:hypothetical protein
MEYKLKNISIDDRYCGPPNSGNGGYSCGLIANHIGPSAKVRLHAPPPLNKPLDIYKSNRVVELKDGDTLLGTGKVSDFTLDIPEPPTISNASNAQNNFIAYEGHFFPSCFVCGPDRLDDGLCLFPGPIAKDDWSLLACTWNVKDNCLKDNGLLKHEFIWAALDCPSYYGIFADVPKVALLGELELKIVKDPTITSPLIIWCWPIKEDGRKKYGGSALATAEGEIIAYAMGTWIELKTDQS